MQGDHITFYSGPIGQGTWVEGVIVNKAVQAGPGDTSAVSIWLDWMEDGEKPFSLWGGKDVRVVTAAEREVDELRAEVRVLTDERDELLRQRDEALEWAAGCPDGCDCGERPVQDVAVLRDVV